MSKILKIIIGILIVIIIAALVLVYYPSEKTPATPEEKLADEWIDTKPIIVTEQGEEKTATAAEWLEAIRQYLLVDKKGNEIGYITYEELVKAKNTGSRPKASTKPKPYPAAPQPVPVPIPTPPPIVNVTPVPTPTPTPTPIPPAPTPAPVPTPTPTPVPTPPPTPIPFPKPTPPTPVCGNNKIESGEQCEPPNTPTCDANCQIIITPPLPTHCTDNQWNVDESDLDCGGSCNTCPPPGNPTYLSCWFNSDCATNNCDMSAAQPLPAINQTTGMIYNTISQLQQLAGQMWIIPYQGRCK